jgi:iron complex transport system ATP-binding protein
MLQVRNLSFSYNKQRVLKDLNILVDKGEILALVGPNGSGKSTLLRCLNGILRPEQGRILLDGQDIQGRNRKWIARHIAFLPQNLEMVQHISVYELIAMGRSPYQTMGWFLNKEDRKLIDWAIDYMNLRPLQYRPLQKLSGGERQRAWIAMILAQDTKIVLLDEPITYLDIKYQWSLMEIIKQVRCQYNKTFILVLHDINQAMMVADRFIVLKDGCIRAHGHARDIITTHLLKDVYDIYARVYDLNHFSRPIIVPAEIS